MNKTKRQALIDCFYQTESFYERLGRNTIFGVTYREGMGERTVTALENYLFEGIEPGSNMAHILANDLMQSVLTADEDRIKEIPFIVGFLYDHVPAGCHGDRKTVVKWVESEYEPQTETQS